MRAIIAGGRDYWFGNEDYYALDDIHAKTPITEVVCGKATGADTCGERWAIARGIPVKEFPADWRPHGVFNPKAGHERNREMAEYTAPDGIAILFPGGKGTENMRVEAVKHRLTIHNYTKGLP